MESTQRSLKFISRQNQHITLNLVVTKNYKNQNLPNHKNYIENGTFTSNRPDFSENAFSTDKIYLLEDYTINKGNKDPFQKNLLTQVNFFFKRIFIFQTKIGFS